MVTVDAVPSKSWLTQAESERIDRELAPLERGAAAHMLDVHRARLYR